MITLKVKKGYPIDYGRRVARIDEDLICSLGMEFKQYWSTNDDNVAEIISEDGRKGTVARCIVHRHRDHGKGIIRLDNLTRNYAGVNIGERVVIKKAKKVSAEKVRMTFSQPVCSDWKQRSVNRLIGHVLMRGERDVTCWGNGIDELVEPVLPVTDVVVITKDTVVELRVGNVRSTSTDGVCDNCSAKNLEYWYTLQSKYGETLRRLCVKCGTADFGCAGAVKA